MPLDADLVENGAVTSPRLIEFASVTAWSSMKFSQNGAYTMCR